MTVTATTTSFESATGDALDAALVLADPDACAALAGLVARLRSIGYDGSPEFVVSAVVRADNANATIVRLAGADPVRFEDALDALGADAVAALTRSGALAPVDDGLALTARIFPMRSVYSFLPLNTTGRDVVYFGPDSLALLECIWAARGYGDHAADLATGNGFIAAALATRYDHVVAADLSHRCVSTAALIPVVNPHLQARFSAVEMDVASGLRAGSFDLVTANAPWVPEVVTPDGPPRLFAAGGPTGFELPKRFIDAAAELLAPDGRAFIACLDLEFDDGRRPLRDHLPSVIARDVAATVTETKLNTAIDYTRWANLKTTGVTRARHVIVELHR